MRIVFLCIFLVFASPLRGQENALIAPWSLGDSREQVLAETKFGPYKNVSITGGLETAHGSFLGEKTTISFVFGETEQLEYLQVWLYEGSSFPKAKKEALRIFDIFASRFGGASVSGIEVDGSEHMDRDSFSVVLDKVLGQAPKLGEKFKRERQVVATTTLDLVPRRGPEHVKIVGQLIHSSRYDSYYIFLFEDLASAPDRRAKSNVYLEKL